jgi:hypothetical protein
VASRAWATAIMEADEVMCIAYASGPLLSHPRVVRVTRVGHWVVKTSHRRLAANVSFYETAESVPTYRNHAIVMHWMDSNSSIHDRAAEQHLGLRRQLAGRDR